MRARLIATSLILSVLVLASSVCSAAYAPEGADVVIPASAQIQPADLAGRLSSAGPQPVILQVGFSVLYAEAHIPKAQYAGPTSKCTSSHRFGRLRYLAKRVSGSSFVGSQAIAF